MRWRPGVSAVILLSWKQAHGVAASVGAAPYPPPAIPSAQPRCAIGWITGIRAVLRRRFGVDVLPIRQGTDCFKFEAHIAGQPQGLALPQQLDHPVKIGSRAGGAFRGFANLVVFVGQRQRRPDGGFDCERPADAGDLAVDLGTVNHGDHFPFFVFGNGFERDTWYQTANLFTLAVLLALVGETASRALRRIFEGIPREGCGEQPLPWRKLIAQPQKITSIC